MPIENGLNRPLTTPEVVRHAGGLRIVKPRRLVHVQVMADPIFQPAERPVVEERRRHGKITQRRRPEFVTIRRVAGHLLQAEVFVLSRSIEDDVTAHGAERRSYLRHASDVMLEVAEHLVRSAGHSVTRDASGFTKEEQGPSLLWNAHGLAIAAGKSIEWSIRKHECELEFRNGETKHGEVNRRSGGHRWEDLAEQLAIGRRGIQELELRRVSRWLDWAHVGSPRAQFGHSSATECGYSAPP